MVVTDSHLWTWCTIVPRTVFCYQCSCFKHSLVLLKSECPPNPALCQCWHYSQDKRKNALYMHIVLRSQGISENRKLCKICSWLLSSERCLSLITPCTMTRDHERTQLITCRNHHACIHFSSILWHVMVSFPSKFFEQNNEYHCFVVSDFKSIRLHLTESITQQ